ncbi:Vps51/Vps67-domain-containing protein [Syncephalis plumigaleata]|nr:Vps51/Vps67-domain-containing protein [Syncephalis plumigaleata]
MQKCAYLFVRIFTRISIYAHLHTMTESVSLSQQQQAIAKGRRTRALLKSYYGLSDHSTTDPLDINGTSFEPNVYTRKLIQEKDTPHLLTHHNKLVTEIRQLDSDMKSLVYENYGKFISATDTMRQMKDRLLSMREQLGEVNQRVERANITDKLVGGDLASDQRRILALDKEHHTLNELGVLFELPSQLLSHLAHDQLAEAVSAFRQAAPLLDQFRSEPGYEGIESESREIMVKVAQRLQKNLHSERADCVIITDATGLLIGTESMDTEELRQQFVARITWRLEQTYERLCEVTTRKGGYLDKQGISLAMDAMSSIHTTLLAELDLAVACYEACFLTPTDGELTTQLPVEAHPTWYRAANTSNMVSYGNRTKQ